MNMDEVYGHMFDYIFNPILSRFQVPEKERTYVMKFYLSGIFAIVKDWVDQNCSDDMDTIIKIIIDCVKGEKKIHE